MVASQGPQGMIRATGPDVAAYLQGQVSQDLNALSVGESAWSLLLDPAGKLVAWFRVHRVGDDEFLIDVEPAAVDAVIARLERFKLRTDATFAVEPGWELLRVRGDDPVPGGELRAAVTWPGFSGTDVLGVGLAAHNPSDESAFDEARIRAAVPRMGVDIDDETIPGEGGKPLIDSSVSFTKGCYTGQELVARIDSRGGNVPRPLRVIEADEPLVIGATVEFEGKEVGTLTSASANVGLSRILRKAEIGAALTVGGVAARVIAPTG